MQTENLFAIKTVRFLRIEHVFLVYLTSNKLYETTSYIEGVYCILLDCFDFYSLFISQLCQQLSEPLGHKSGSHSTCCLLFLLLLDFE